MARVDKQLLLSTKGKYPTCRAELHKFPRLNFLCPLCVCREGVLTNKSLVPWGKCVFTQDMSMFRVWSW